MPLKKTIILLSVLLLITIVSGYLILFIPLKEKKRCTKTTIATIESVEEKTSHTKGDSGGDRRVFRCKYSFSVSDKKYSGYEYSKQYNNSWLNSVGEHVYILYNENSPTEFILSPFISHYCTWFFVPIASGILTILIFFGIITGHIKEGMSAVV